MRKTFLLGVGCQKGGTTWFYDYLSRHPNANMGFRKEYHVFDRLYVPEFAQRLPRLKKDAALLLERGALPDAKARNVSRMLSFYADVESYFDYFWSLANRSDETILTGDITPEYCSLPRQAFARIREGLAKRNFDIRVVFLMRDPVARCISHMQHRQRMLVKGGSRPETDIRRAYATRFVEMRTRYDLTIANLEAVFPRDETFYCFFEQLFTQESMARAASFLSIPYQVPDFGRKVNVSRNEMEVDQRTRREIFDHYRVTYDFVAERFGKAEVRKVWESYRDFGGG